MLNSKLIKVIHYKKIIVSIIFGLLGFWLNFHAVHFMQFTDLKVSILFGLLFPLIIALFWGWKYGLLSALFGGCQTMWWLWGTNGYGIFYAVPIFTLWIVWHGFWADYRRTHERKWYHSMYVVEIVFRIFSILGFYAVFRWLVSLNPPPWTPQLTNNFVPYSWIKFVMVKHVITAYVLLLFCDVLRHFGPVRKLFIPKEKKNYKGTTYIISAFMLVGLLFWIMHTTMDYFVFYKGKDTFLNLMSVNIPSTSLFIRNIMLLLFLVIGVVLSRIYLLLQKKDILIRESEEKYRTFVENAPDAFYLSNMEGKFLDVNEAACKILGYTREELLNLSIPDVDINFPKDKLSKILGGLTYNESQYVESAHQTKNGKIIPVEVQIQTFGPKDKPLLLSLARDVTERRKTEQKIKDISNNWDVTFDAITDSISIIDENRNILQSNRAFRDFLGKTDDELKTGKCFHFVHKTESPVPKCPFRHAKKSKQRESMEMEINGGIWQIIVDPIINEKGNVTGAVHIISDITKRKQAEEQIKKDLKIQTALIQEIYHRTKNNMAVVSAMLSMQSRRSDSEYVKTTFREINNKIQAMSLVHQKLYKVKDLSNINLKDYIEDLAKLIMQSYGVLSEKIELKFDLQDVKVLIDSAVPLGLIINELISNIFKHAFPNRQEGKILIRLFKEEDGTINLELIDNGIGFSQNFDPRKDGSMGLTSVFSITEYQLKGEISVKSENGLRWHIKIKDDLHKERVQDE